MHCIDASHTTVKYPSGHRLIQVAKIITQTDDETEIVADAEHQTNCIFCGYDCSLTPQICAQRKRLDRVNKLPCFHSEGPYMRDATMLVSISQIWNRFLFILLSSHNHYN
jgi:hypothetical protein